MTQQQSIQFQNGATYERYMGVWSQLTGDIFLEWLAPPSQQQWLDVGCGNGAFTERLITHWAPASVHGIDPSSEQLAYARTRPALATAQLDQGDAMALPYANGAFDIAVMPLVIFFVPHPAQGVAEMVRVVRPGGLIAAYAWDMEGGGFPYHALQTEIRALGITVPEAPSPQASRIDVLQELWTDAGLVSVETRTITVHRTFSDFDDFWTTALGAPSVGKTLASLSPDEIAHLKARMQAQLPVDENGRITYSARANAVKGIKR